MCRSKQLFLTTLVLLGGLGPGAVEAGVANRLRALLGASEGPSQVALGPQPARAEQVPWWRSLAWSSSVPDTADFNDHEGGGLLDALGLARKLKMWEDVTPGYEEVNEEGFQARAGVARTMRRAARVRADAAAAAVHHRAREEAPHALAEMTSETALEEAPQALSGPAPTAVRNETADVIAVPAFTVARDEAPPVLAAPALAAAPGADSDAPPNGSRRLSMGPPMMAPPELTGGEQALEDARREGGMPALPDKFGPWNVAWSNSVAICSVMRDENATDVREWLSYHKFIGVDHVYLTENNSESPIKSEIMDFIESGFVTYATEDRSHAQLLVYRHCIKRHRKQYNWMAFIDADEFLAVREKNTSLKAVLNSYKHNAGVGVYWVMVGPSNHTVRPESGGVLRHYTMCWPFALDHIKIIVNTFFVSDIARHPHSMMFRGMASPVDEGKNPIPYSYASDQCARGKTDEECELIPGHQQRTNALRSINRLALFHYVTRSLQDFQIKQRRGGGNNPDGKKLSYFDTIQRGQTNNPMCSELAQLAETANLP